MVLSKERKYELLLSERNCLETVLGCVVAGVNAFKRVWISDDILKTLQKVVDCGNVLMSTTSCGDLTGRIIQLGETFSSTQLTRLPSSTSSTVDTGIIHTTTTNPPWVKPTPEMIEWAEKTGPLLITDIKNRIAELTKEISKFDVLPNPDQILEIIFPDFYKNLECPISSDDDFILKSYTDADIRARLARILGKCDYITQAEKGELKERAKTPHTGYEVSDLWVYVQLDGQSIRIDFVVKSAKEFLRIIPRNVWDQWTRPVEGISNLSLLISYARLSVPLENRKDNYNNDRNCLRAINGDALAILFKSYNELTPVDV